jgi:DNA-binding MarR family transcriptional regulator
MRIDQYLAASPFFMIQNSYERINRQAQIWLSKDKINYLQALILLAVFFEKKIVVQPSHLAKTFKTSRGNASHCISKLSAMGFIERVVSKKDARNFEIILTVSGKRKAVQLIKKFDEMQSDLEKVVDIKTIEDFNKTLQMIVVHFTKRSSQAV